MKAARSPIEHYFEPFKTPNIERNNTPMKRTFINPVIPGFTPDPSICRVDNDYYLITSSFEYFPGVPLFHSRDLVHWRSLGHILDRPSQLNLDNALPSQGIYAPTIRHHDGTFYMVVTVRGPDGQGGFRDDNIIVSTEDPAGEWSEPITLTNQPAVIDPSLFFDDDGRAWYMANARVDNEPYPGYRDIWLQELDLDKIELVGERFLLWNGALKEASAPEAPHIYKIDGCYYLVLAEAGTFHDHAVTIARADDVRGPYQGNPRNPILTHRHLGLEQSITNPGHADLIDTPAGEWWMVALASRPYGGYFYNLGRETFLTPVAWEEGWPVVNPGHGRIRMEEVAPDLEPHPWPSEPACDHFDAERLSDQWHFIRTPRTEFHSLSERPGYLRLKLRPERLEEICNPSFIGRPQRHINFAARTAFEFAPQTEFESAGLALLQNNDNHFRFVLQGNQVCLIERRKGEEQDLGSKTLSSISPQSTSQCDSVPRIYLKVEARGQEYSFYAATSPETWSPIAEQVDGRVLSPQVAGGFVGAHIGIYATSNGQPSENAADFDSFEYAALPDSLR